MAGYKWLGNVEFRKLPTLVPRGLITKCNTNYPTIKQIFDEVSNVITTLALSKPKKKGLNNTSNNQSNSNSQPSKSSLNTHKSSAPTLTNLHVKSKSKTKDVNCVILQAITP